MRQPSSARSLAVLSFVAAFLLAAPGMASANGGAAASSSAGGAQTRERPVVQRIVCAEGRTTRCGNGQVLKLRGSSFSDVEVVIFRGGKGSADDRVAEPTEQSPRRILVEVPDDARSGRIQVRSRAAGVSRSGPKLRVLSLPTLRTPASLLGLPAVFPIAGEHDIGGSAVQRFGGARGQEGQDVFAECGSPVVAAHAGVGQVNGSVGRGGN